MRDKLVLFFILLLGFLLRIIFLGKTSFWMDEACLINTPVEVSITGIIDDVLIFKNISPLYLLFIHYWKLLGTSEFILRLPGVIFGTLTIVACYVLAKDLFGKKVSFVATYILAISPFSIYYSREARMYALVGLLSLISIYCFVRFVKTGKTAFLSAFMVVSVINFYTHFMTPLIFLCCQLTFFIYYHHNQVLLKRWYWAAAIMLLTLIPWIAIVVYKLGTTIIEGGAGWFPDHLPQITPLQIFFTLKNFALGYNAPKIIYIPVAVFCFFLFLRGARWSQQNRPFVFLSASIVAIPILIMFLISFWRVFYGDRYVFASALFFYVLAGKGIAEIGKPSRRIMLSLFTITAAFSLFNYYRDVLPGSFAEHLAIQSKKEQRSAAHFVMDNFRVGDGIFHTNFNTNFPFEYYFKIRPEDKHFVDVDNGLYLRVDGETGHVVPLRFSLVGKDADVSSEITMSDYQRIWLVNSSFIYPNTLYPENCREVEHYPECREIHKVLKFMDTHFQQVLEKRFKGIRVLLYEVR